MALDVFSENLISLRKQKDLSIEQVAIIAGVEVEAYEKMELGFAEIPYDVLKKLAKFYGVEITYFISGHSQSVVEKTDVSVKKGEDRSISKANNVFKIIGFVASILLALYFLVTPIFFDGCDYIYIWNFFDPFYGGDFEQFAILYLMFNAAWGLTASIIFMVSKNLYLNKFGFIAKIISTTTNSIGVVLVVGLMSRISIFDETSVVSGYLMIIVAAVIFDVLKLVWHKKDKKTR